MQVSSAILFRVPLCNRALIEKALSQLTNIQHIFSAKSVKRRQLPPLCLSCLRACLPFSYFKIASLVCSLVFVAVMPLNKNSFGMDITCSLTRHCVSPLLLAEKHLSSQLELNLLFSPDISLVTLLFC